MRLRRLPACLLIVSAVAVAALSTPQSGLAQQSHALERRGAGAFWTPTRVARAVAAPAPGSRLGGGWAPKLAPPAFLSEPVADPSTPPYSANGLVLFRLHHFLYSCSAAIVDAPSARVVWTAAHCIRDPGRGGQYATKWAFVPAYDDGARPYGVWPASELWVAPDWATNRSSERVDFGAAVIKRAAGVSVERAVGAAYPLAFNQPSAQDWEAVGYPAGAAFGDQMWHCVSPLYRSDHARPERPGPAPIAIGCDATEGASGGAWISQAGTLGAVSTYGYTGQPDVLFGTYLGSQARGLFNRIRSR
jgi:V8-like Glu-specific endopeptidase